MADDAQGPYPNESGLDEDGLLTTDEMKAIAASKTVESDVDPTRWQRLWSRLGHIYRTRTRTTTLILIVAFFGSVLLYGFTTSFYGVAPTTSNEQQRQQIEERRTPEFTPERTPSRTPDSTTSETATSPSPTSPSRSGPLDFLVPKKPSPSSDSETASPTTSVPAR